MLDSKSKLPIACMVGRSRKVMVNLLCLQPLRHMATAWYPSCRQTGGLSLSFA
jgi:hypothetical protein